MPLRAAQHNTARRNRNKQPFIRTKGDGCGIAKIPVNSVCRRATGPRAACLEINTRYGKVFLHAHMAQQLGRCF